MSEQTKAKKELIEALSVVYRGIDNLIDLLAAEQDKSAEESLFPDTPSNEVRLEALRDAQELVFDFRGELEEGKE